MNKLLSVTSAVAFLTALAGPVYADPNEKTVFVTSATFSGNLGGLTGADDKCQAAADGPASIVPPGTYIAWLSTSVKDAIDRLPANTSGYFLPSGKKVADSTTDVASCPDEGIVIAHLGSTGRLHGRYLSPA